MGSKKHSDKHTPDSDTSSKSNRKVRGDRELIDTGTDKRHVRRDEKGQFTESDVVGRSLSQDVKDSGRGNRGHAKIGRYTGRSGRGDRERPGAERRRLSEDEVERLLEAEGAIRLPSVQPSTTPRPAPVDVPGKPLSETVIEERR